MRKPKGRQGSWFAEWEGEQLPCVHQHWTKGIWPEYLDPHCDTRPEWPAFIAALSQGRKAILTTSKFTEEDGKWRRASYVAIWEVENVRTEAGTLRFRFVRPLVQF
jgi:hypothetical protein